MPLSVEGPGSPAAIGDLKELQRSVHDCDSLCQRAREARLQGRGSTARRLLGQALYLDPDWAPAYLELGLLTAVADPEKARKHRSTALALLGEGVSDGRVAESLRELERALS